LVFIVYLKLTPLFVLCTVDLVAFLYVKLLKNMYDVGGLPTTMERMQCTTNNYGEKAVHYEYYLKGGLVYLTMPTMTTTESYGGKIFFPDALPHDSLAGLDYLRAILRLLLAKPTNPYLDQSLSLSKSLMHVQRSDLWHAMVELLRLRVSATGLRMETVGYMEPCWVWWLKVIGNGCTRFRVVLLQFRPTLLFSSYELILSSLNLRYVYFSHMTVHSHLIPRLRHLFYHLP
jgi:hypothetical protein